MNQPLSQTQFDLLSSVVQAESTNTLPFLPDPEDKSDFLELDRLGLVQWVPGSRDGENGYVLTQWGCDAYAQSWIRYSPCSVSNDLLHDLSHDQS